MEPNQVAVVIPFYRSSITAYEDIALTQCGLILKNYHLIAVKPKSLTLPDTGLAFTQIINFDDTYFESIQGYNRLMLDEVFYKAFLNYTYILLYQLDAFVFKDELQYWCNQNLDYIGAPWLRKSDPANIFKAGILASQSYLSTKFNLKKRGLPNKYQFENKVGNGGFSLRKTQVFYDLCMSMKDRIAFYLSRNEHQYHEDVFWSIEINRRAKHLKIGSIKQALTFAFENSPERAFRLNNNHVPFGCHAWDKHPEFWRPIFKQYNFII